MTNSIDAASLERLATSETPDLIRLAYRILGSADDAEEVVQAAFLEMLTKCPELKKVINPKGFLRHMVICRSLDALRKRRGTHTLDFVPPSHRSPQPDAIVIAREWLSLFQIALCSLSPRQSEIFALRYLSNTSNTEIAKDLGLSENAVAVALRKARIELQALIEKD